jgi:hypothetical protein
MLDGGVSIICHRTRQNFDLHGCDFFDRPDEVRQESLSQGSMVVPERYSLF